MPCLVALASLLITPIYLAKFTNGETLGLAAFIAAIVGGFNQVRGAIAGGLLLGVRRQSFGGLYLDAISRRDPAGALDRRSSSSGRTGLLGRPEERTV